MHHRLAMARLFSCVALLLMVAVVPVLAQDLFEIQVYPSETVEPGVTMFEFHTNFIPSGTKTMVDGLYANNHQFHETLEITHGFTKYFETGLYIETAPYVPGVGAKFAGWHIRPRFRFPDWERFPFKVSISLEYAFNQTGFNPDPQTLEIRPIFDRQQGRLYLSINPDLSVATKGPDAGASPVFEPDMKVGWDFTKAVNAGFEYYGQTGPVTQFAPLLDQHHLLFAASDLNLSPDWEINFGVGRGLTSTSEHWLVKGIIGYRFKH
jgi:hypothetical protein